MKKNRLFIIFIALITLSLTGCGSSSSNNPLANESINNGLVSVNGNVKNLDGNGTVSFYTPTDIYVKDTNINSSASISVANNEIYTFNIDEEGNYFGQIPSGDYYVIAQNSDGSMKAATSRLSLNCSSRAETSVPEPTKINFVLVPTINIIGILEPYTTLTQNPIVYIEDMPFVDLNTKLDTTNSKETYYSFTLKDVPLADSYSICSNIWVGNNFRYRYSYKTTSSQIETARTTREIKGITISNFEPITLSGKNIKMQLVDIEGEPFLGALPIKVFTTNQIIPLYTDDKGYTACPIESIDEIVAINIDDMHTIKGNEITTDNDGKILLEFPYEF